MLNLFLLCWAAAFATLSLSLLILPPILARLVLTVGWLVLSVTSVYCCHV